MQRYEEWRWGSEKTRICNESKRRMYGKIPPFDWRNMERTHYVF